VFEDKSHNFQKMKTLLLAALAATVFSVATAGETAMSASRTTSSAQAHPAPRFAQKLPHIMNRNGLLDMFRPLWPRPGLT
jgi:hypothetical protein